jgi:hypothetical protein
MNEDGKIQSKYYKLVAVQYIKLNKTMKIQNGKYFSIVDRGGHVENN